MALPQIVQGTANNVHPPLCYVMLHYWMHVFSALEFAVRFLSVIFGVAAIPIIYLLGRRFSIKVGVVSASSIVVHCLMQCCVVIQYSLPFATAGTTSLRLLKLFLLLGF
jgi:4-amino-4-deoxy-L-arabinose transferase-like glycosyltransferase